MAEKLTFDIEAGKNTLEPELKKTQRESKKVETAMSKWAARINAANLAAKKTTTQVTKIGLASRAATAATTALSASMGRVGKAATALNANPVIALLALALAVKNVVSESIELENSLIGLRSVASATGNDIGKIEDAAKSLASDGLIPLSQVSNSLKSLLASGLSGDEAIKTFKSLRNAASFNRQGQLSLGEAVAGAAQGIKNQNSIMLDNSGVTKNISLFYRDFAKSIGTTAGKLTEAQKTQAIYNGIQEEGALFTGDYNRLLDTFSGAATEAGGSLKFLVAEIGNLITSSPIAINSLKAIGKHFRDWTDVLKDLSEDNPSERLLEISKSIDILEKSSSRLGKSIANNKSDDFFGKGGKAEQVRFTQQIKELANLKEEQLELNKFFQKDGGDKELGGGKSPEDDAKVIHDRAVNELLTQIQDERDVLETTRLEAKDDAAITQNEEKLLALETQLKAEQDLKNLSALEEKALKTKNAKELGKIETALETKRLTDKKNALKRETQLAQVHAQANINIAQGAAGLIAAVASEGSKTAFLVQKAAAIAGAVVATQLAMARAPAEVGPVAGIPLATKIGIAGAINVATIVATGIKGFAQGGIVDAQRSSLDNTAVPLAGGEVVLERAQQVELFNMAKGNGKENQDEKDTPLPPIILEIDGVEIARALRNVQADGVLI